MRLWERNGWRAMREVAGGMGCKVRVGGSVRRLRCRVGELLIEPQDLRAYLMSMKV